ncbi:MAG: tetratricopeptide repeat-containing sulfotransferase family protein [Gammaproteobacteria bacterium]
MPLDRLLAAALEAHRKQELERAEQLYSALLKRAPDAPAALHHYGVLLHQLGQPQRARTLLSKAERLAPDQPDFLFNHARVLWEQTRRADAIARLEKLLALQPDSANVALELAMALTTLGKRSEACSRLENWLVRHPNEYAVWLSLGDLRLHMGELELATQAWNNARKALGEMGATALQRIGNLQLQAGDPDAASNSFHEAIACNPGSSDAHCGLAAAASQLGDFDTQRRESNAALDIDPLCYTAWYQLTLSPDPNTASTAESMQQAISHAADDPQAWLLYMALGRVLEKLERYDAAFDAFVEAQRRRGAATDESYAQEMLRFQRAREYLNADFTRRRPSRNTLNERPIFIVGMPRSGTTLVEAILSTHPRVAGGGEMRFLYTWLQKNRGTEFEGTPPEWLVQADDQTLACLADEWRNALDEARGGHERVSDKFPENFYLLGLIAMIFPQASIVHVRRDPRDTCVSCFTTALTGRGVSAASTLTEIGNYYREYATLMDHWRQVLGSERIIEVEYEQLIRAPEPTVRGLLADVGLDWNPECLNFHKSKRPVATASLYQVRQPLYVSSIGRWQHYESHLQPLFDGLSGILSAEK